MKKAILKVDLHDDKQKQKAMKIVSGLPGVESIAMDMKDQKLTVTGDMDPVHVVSKLRKLCHTSVLSVGPAKEPEKKKDEPKKDEGKKDGAKKEGGDKKDDDKKKDPVAEYVKQYQAMYPHLTQHYYVRSAEEDPNACVIC